MGSHMFSVLLCSSFPLLVAANTLQCENVKKVSFLSFVARQTGFQVENRVLSLESETALRTSDALVRAAIELAVERINADRNVLSNVTLEVRQLSDARYDRVSKGTIRNYS